MAREKELAVKRVRTDRPARSTQKPRGDLPGGGENPFRMAADLLGQVFGSLIRHLVTGDADTPLPKPQTNARTWGVDPKNLRVEGDGMPLGPGAQQLPVTRTREPAPGYTSTQTAGGPQRIAGGPPMPPMPPDMPVAASASFERIAPPPPPPMDPYYDQIMANIRAGRENYAREGRGEQPQVKKRTISRAAYQQARNGR